MHNVFGQNNLVYGT